MNRLQCYSSPTAAWRIGSSRDGGVRENIQDMPRLQRRIFGECGEGCHGAWGTL